MASKGALVVRFIGDTKDFDRASKSVQNSTGKFGALGKVGRAAGVALAAGAAIAGAAAIKVGADSVRAASDMSESLSKANVVFGKSAKEIIDWSNTSATAFGMSQQAALEASGTLGNLLLAMGKTPKQASKMSAEMVGLAADLGSFNNVPVEEVLAAIRSGLTGEIAPLRRFGVNLTDATMKAKAMELGLYSGKGALDVTAKSSAAYALILEQTKTAQGDFARTGNGLANQQKILRAQFDNLKVSIGQKLLPVVVKLMNWMTSTGVPALSKVGAVIQNDIMPAFRAVGDFVQAKILPAFKGIGDGSGRTSEALSRFKANFSSVFASVVSISQSVAGFAEAFWGRYGDLITKFGIGTLRNFITQLQGFADIITGIFKTIAAVLKGDWSGAWAGIKQIARGAVQVIGAQVSQLWNVMRTVFAAGGRALADLMRAGWSAAVEAVRAGVKAQIRLVASLPGRIVSALGDLSQLLVNAGKAVISGLISGITSKISDLTSKLKSVTNLIPKHKGPESKDRKLLEPAGRAIMDGLLAGIEGRKVQVTKALQKITDLFANVRDRLANLKDIREGFLSTFSADSIFGVDLSEGGGIGALIDFQQKQAQQAAQLMADIQRVASMGLSKSLISQLQAQGTSGAQQLHALAGGSGDQIQLLNSLNAQTQASLQAAGMLAGNTVRGGNIDADISRASREEQLIERIIKRLEKMNDNQMVVIEVDSEVFIKAVKKRNRRHGVATAGM